MALSFAADLKAKCDKMLVEVDRQCQLIAYDLFTEIVTRTTVVSGLLANNWFPGTGVDFSSEITTAEDISGSGSKARTLSELGKGTFLGKDGTMTLSNNLDYAYEIEYAGPNTGKKYQQPEGFVRVSVVKIAARYKYGGV